MVAASLAFLMLAQEPGIVLPETHKDRKLTLTLPATRAAVAIPEIGKSVGLTLDVSTNTANEVLVVEVKDAPLKQVLDRIADVTSGQWAAGEGGTFRLVADGNRRAREDRDRAESEQKRVAESLKRFAEGIAKPLNTVQDAIALLKPQVEKVESRSRVEDFKDIDMDEAMTQVEDRVVDAGSRAARRIALALGPSAFAGLKEGDRIVYSTAPTRMQRPIPNGGAIMQTMMREMDLLMKAQQELEKAVGEESEEVYVGPVGVVPRKLLFIVENQGGMTSSMSIGASLAGYDAEGTLVVESSLWFRGSSPVRARDDKPLPADKEVELSAQSKEFAQLMSTFMGGGLMGGPAPTPPPASPLFDAAMDRPTEFDPLRFVVSDCVLAIARAEGSQLVANLPDYSLGMFNELAKGKVGVLEAKRSLSTEGKVKIETKDGWVTMQPSEPAESRVLRADRLGLERLMQSTKDRVMPSLDDLAAYALSSPVPSEGDAAILYFVFRMPGSLGLFMSPETWTVLQFYGTLSPVQRQSLGQGSALPFTALSPAQRTLVQRMTFGAGATLITEEMERGAGMEDSFGFDLFSEMGSFGGARMRGRATLMTEPTELLPNGLVAQGTFSVKSETVQAVMPDGRDLFSMMMGSFSPKQLGAMSAMTEMAAQEGPDLSGIFGRPSLDRMRLGERASYTFTFNVAPQVKVQGRLTDHRFARTGPIVKLQDLPAAFRKEMDEAKAKMKKQMEEFGGGDGPPPPPQP